MVYLHLAIAASPSDLVFPAPDGKMLRKTTQLEFVLRRAMRRAGIVTGYVHKCRRKGCGHQEPTADANPRRCPKCNFELFAVGQVRSIRFHHLRHTTASLLLMSGADLAAVPRIMRHQDPRTTTEFYGHLAGNYLKKEIERLSYGPAPAEAAASPPQPAQEPRLSLVAGGAQEPPLHADTRADARPAAPFVTRLLPNPGKGRAPSTEGVAARSSSLQPSDFVRRASSGAVQGDHGRDHPAPEGRMILVRTSIGRSMCEPGTRAPMGCRTHAG